MKRDPVAIRVYASLLHLYPRRFRDQYGPDMVLLVREQLHDTPALRVVARSAIDLAMTVPAQHLEIHMRTPRRLVSLFFLVLAAAGLGLAIVGGSEPVSLILGLALATGAGAIGVVSWRQTAHVHESSVTEGWWKVLLAGPILLAGVILAAGVGIEAWFLGIATVLAAALCTALGIAMGIAHLVRSHLHSAPA